MKHDIDCDLDEDCHCALPPGMCTYCAGDGVAFDPSTLQRSSVCPACAGTGYVTVEGECAVA